MTRLPALATLLVTLGLTGAALATPAEVTAPTNLRTGPAVGYPVLTLLAPGSPVEIYGCLDDVDWCDVGYGELRGWMSSRFLASARRWYPERPMLTPPVFSPPPIYAEPPVYANPPPIRRPPVYAEPDYGWAPAPVDPGYIVPPPGFVYRPPVMAAPPVAVYPTRPLAPRPHMAPRPPEVATAPPALRPSQPVVPPGSTPSVNPPLASPPLASPPATVTPQQPLPSTSANASPPVTAPTTMPATTPAKPVAPKYGSAVGKPGAPCKWVNGVCRSD